VAINVRTLSPGAVRESAPPILALLGIAIALGMSLPLIYLIIRATENNAIIDTWTDASTIRTLVRTCLLAVAVGAGTLAISLPAAWLTTATDLPGRRLWAVLLSLPLVFPSYVGAFTLIAALGPRGMLHDLFGIDHLPEIYGFRGAWLVLTLFTFPYVMIPLRAAISGLDRSMEEAARSLGASPLGAFVRVTLPQLRPAIAAGLLLVVLYVLSDFGAVSLMRFDSLTRVIFVQYKSAFDRSTAAALALLLVAVAMAVIWLEAATRGRARYHTAAVRRAAVVRLGHWKWPGLAFCSGIALVSLVLPMSVLVYWVVRGLDAGQSVSFIGDAAVNSVQASLFGAIACLAAALPIALLSVRYPGQLGRLIEKVSYSGYALPGISIALALVFFAANYVPAIYQTLPLLIFAYVVRFLPQAMGACRTSLLQTDPKTEEAARGLGYGRIPVLGRITLPQMLPGLSAGGLLVFLTVMKELPATLLLSPIGFDTLATEIWASTNEALFARAAVPAILLVLISAVPTVFLVWRAREVS
jgi:iron(III) transport system permease protein